MSSVIAATSLVGLAGMRCAADHTEARREGCSVRLLASAVRATRLQLAREASASCGSRVLRGGSWVSNPRLLRSAYRERFPPDDRYSMLGFRVARTL